MQSLMLKASYLYVKNDGSGHVLVADADRAVRHGRRPCRPGQPAQHRQLRRLQAAVFQPEGHLQRTTRTGRSPPATRTRSTATNDIATNGYYYVAPIPAPGTVNTSASYLNGYDAFTNGHQNIFYATVTLQVRCAAAADRAAADGGSAACAAPPAAQPAPAPAAPAPAPAPAPQVQKITLDSKVLFDFDKAVLKPDGKEAIDSQVVGKLAAGPEARSGPRDGPHRPPRHGCLQPEAVASAAPMPCATTWSARACTRTRSRRSAWARSSRSCSATRRT